MCHNQLWIVINLHLFVRLLITCFLLSTTWSLVWLYLSYLTTYAYLYYHLSTFWWNPLGSPSSLTTTHSLLFLLIPHSFRLMPSLLYHMLILSYAHHWLIRYFFYSYAFQLDDSLSSSHSSSSLPSYFNITVVLLTLEYTSIDKQITPSIAYQQKSKSQLQRSLKIVLRLAILIVTTNVAHHSLLHLLHDRLP